MKTPKLTIDQIVFALPCGNEKRSNPTLVEAKVTSVAKKYFTLEGIRFRGSKFHLPGTAGHADMQEATDFCNNWQIYTSMKEIEDEKQRPIILAQLTAKLSTYSVDQLTELFKTL